MANKFIIKPGLQFDKAAAKLQKRYKGLEEDFAKLFESLKANPLQGDRLGKGCYKVQMRISAKGGGKRDGARVITCIKVLGETIHLLTIYDKSEKADLEPGELQKLLKEEGLV